MKKLINLSSIITFLLCLITSSAFAQTKDAKSYLFMQTAKWAELQKADNSDNYVLTLHNVSPVVSYFTDRPNRITGAISLERFLKIWDHGEGGLKKDAPNAGASGIRVFGLTDNNIKTNIVLTLSQPIYNAKKGELTYQATTLSGEKVELSKKNKLFFRHAVIFIDNVSGICWSC